MFFCVIDGTDDDVILCCHGYGSNYQIANIIDSYHVVKDHLVSFNFPDYNILQPDFDWSKATYDTLDELLPPLYILI